MGTQWRDHPGTGRTKYRNFGMHEAAAAWGPIAFSWRAGPSASLQRRAGGCEGRQGWPMATALAVGRGGSVVASRVTLLPMPAGPPVPGWQLARSQYVPVIAIRFWGNGGVQDTYRE